MCDYWQIKKPRALKYSSIISFWRDQVHYKPDFVTLSGGEPLLYPHLFRLARFFHSDFNNLVLSTNGVLLANYISEVAEFFNKVIISVDGCRAETIRSIRGIDVFDQLLNTVDILLHQSSRMKIVLKMTIQKKNFREVPGFIELAQRCGVDGVAFTVPDLYSTSFIHHPHYIEEKKKEIMLSPSESAQFEAMVRDIEVCFKDLFQAGFILEGNLTKFAEYFKYHCKVNPRLEPRTCDIATTRLIVNSDGQIRPCFYLEPFGNIDERHQGDFYNSETASSFRRQFNPTTNRVCQQCYQFLDWRFS